jgi:hypothetical protein
LPVSGNGDEDNEHVIGDDSIKQPTFADYPPSHR